jgi:hypothetical protein
MALTQVASGLIASVSGASLTGTQNIPKATLPTGSVLQVVYSNVHTGQQSTTSASFVSTGFSASITPTSATSKILVTVTGAITNLSSNQYVVTTIARGSTVLDSTGLAYYENSISSGYVWVPATMIYLDSPATTSSTSYTVYFKTSSASSGYFGNATAGVTFTLMEIAA